MRLSQGNFQSIEHLRPHARQAHHSKHSAAQHNTQLGAMANKETATTTTAAAPAGPVLGKSGKKICCSCPETKQARDLCVVTNGEDQCKDIIEKHKACLRSEGFTVK